jgi:ATP-dependent RNA helicase DDX52/ROK1
MLKSNYEQGVASGKGKSTTSEDVPTAEPGHLPSELDFFASTDHSTSHSAQNKSNKRKRNEASEAGKRLPIRTPSPELEDLPAPPVQKISLSGPEPLPRSFKSFDDFLPGSDETIRKNLRKNGVHQLWGVQGAVSGALLDEHNRDVMVIAPTGSGKTLSYLLPLVVRLGKPCRSSFKLFKNGDAPTPGEQGIRSIILLPTHELALQIHNEVLKLCEGHAWRTLLLEKSTEKAVMDSVKEEEGGTLLGIDILVATPERLHKLVSSGALPLHE